MRAADPEDAEAIAAVYIGSRRRHVAFAPLAHSEEEVREWIKRELIPKSRVIVIEEDGAVVAMMALAVRSGAGWIDQLYVSPEHTSRGHGSTLLEFAKKQIPAPIFLHTFQENVGARRFYERHGFEAEHFSDGHKNEERCPDVLYRLAKTAPNQPDPDSAVGHPPNSGSQFDCALPPRRV